MSEAAHRENVAASATSLGDMLRLACARFADRPAQMVPEGKEFRTFLYADLWEIVGDYARALHALGLQRGDALAIMAETCQEWAWTDWAAQTLGVVTVPIYPTLPKDQAEYIAKDAGVKAVVILEERLRERVAEAGVPVVPLRGEASTILAARAKESTLTREAWAAGIGASGAEDIATIIYTSGTTGQPKGAELPHRAFLTLCSGILDTLPIDENDVFLSFLPLAHVFERFAGHILPVSSGACVAYAGSLASLAGDMQKVRPTIMLAVPRFLEATRAKILENAAKQPPLRKFLFDLNLKQGIRRSHGQFAPLAGVLDHIVGAKIREKTGGRIKFFVSGGAALAPHVADFYRAVGLDVLQGYGLTETCAAASVNHPARNKPHTVGEPIRGVEVSIAGDGEILIRGPGLMTGYHHLPEATAEVMDADGWFHTGDIGEFEGAHLRITDRKKDLLVLGNGKNIAPQKIENKLKESDLIQEAVLFGDGMEYCCALIIPEFERLAVHAKAQGWPEESSDKLIERPEIQALVRAEVDKANKSLADFEKVKKHRLLAAPFSIESGELTPSLKVRRKVVKEKFGDLIRTMER